MSGADPIAVIVTGPAGSGKTTLGRELARLLRAGLLDQDVLTGPLTAVIGEMTGAGDDLDDPAMTGAVRTARYDAVLDAAQENLRLGLPVVLTAPFTRETADPAGPAALARRLSAGRVAVVRVQVPPGVARARRSARDLPRDRAARTDQAQEPDERAGSASVAERAEEAERRGHCGPRAVLELTADGLADPGREASRIIAILRQARIRDPIETSEPLDRP